MSDRIAVINHGRLAQVDTPEVIYNRPANAFVADFIGESTIVPLTRRDGGALFFNDQLIADASPDEDIREWSLVIRPERLRLIDGQSSPAEHAIVFDAKIREFVFQGETACLIAAVDDRTEVSVRFGTGAAMPSNAFRPDENVSVGLERDDVILVPGAPVE